MLSPGREGSREREGGWANGGDVAAVACVWGDHRLSENLATSRPMCGAAGVLAVSKRGSADWRVAPPAGGHFIVVDGSQEERDAWRTPGPDERYAYWLPHEATAWAAVGFCSALAPAIWTTDMAGGFN